MVVWDDLVLIKWLVFNVRRKVAKMMCPDGKNKKKVYMTAKKRGKLDTLDLSRMDNEDYLAFEPEARSKRKYTMICNTSIGGVLFEDEHNVFVDHFLRKLQES